MYNITSQEITSSDAYYNLPEKATVKFFHSEGELYCFLTKTVTVDYIYRFIVFRFPTEEDSMILGIFVFLCLRFKKEEGEGDSSSAWQKIEGKTITWEHNSNFVFKMNYHEIRP